MEHTDKLPSKMERLMGFGSAAANYVPKHLVVGGLVTGAKLVGENYPTSQIGQFLARAFTHMPRIDVAGLSASAFGLSFLISAVSDLVIKQSNSKGNWFIKDRLSLEFNRYEETAIEIVKDKKVTHYKDAISDNYLKCTGKLVGRFIVTALTGAVASLAFTAACSIVAGSVFGWGTAALTGASIGAAVFVAKTVVEVAANVFMKVWNRNLNNFLETDHKKAAKEVLVAPVTIDSTEIKPVEALTYDVEQKILSIQIGDINTTLSEGGTVVEGSKAIMKELEIKKDNVLAQINKRLEVLEKMNAKANSLIKWFKARKDEIQSKLDEDINEQITALKHAKDAWTKVTKVTVEEIK